MQETKVIELKSDLEDVRDYIEKNFYLTSAGSKGNFAWQLKKEGSVATAYSSGKIVLQGSDEKTIKKIFLELNQKFGAGSERFIPHIGVDEAGKGDFFGGLVIAGVFVDSVKTRDRLLEIGVQDSKNLRNTRAIKIKKEILNLSEFVEVINISPAKYDELHAGFKNVNKMLAWGHARIIENLLEKIPDGVCPKAVIDQFSKKKSRVIEALMDRGSEIEVEQRHKGEDDIAVAAASIVARGAFLESMDKMDDEYNFHFPLGASNVIQSGQKFVKEFGVEKLNDVAKVSFRTSQKVLA
jgi:ribonuclease HIII